MKTLTVMNGSSPQADDSGGILDTTRTSLLTEIPDPITKCYDDLCRQRLRVRVRGSLPLGTSIVGVAASTWTE